MTPYQAQMQRIKTVEVEPGIEIGYEELGSGDKYLISLHMGFPEKYYVREFAKHGYHVFLLWNRGSGPSTRPDEDYGEDWYNVWAGDVVHFADKMGIDKFVYTGASHGSGTGWHIAWKYPERLKAFIAVVCGPQLIDGDPECFKNIVAKNPDYDFVKDFNDDPAIIRRRANGEAYSAECHANQIPRNYHRPFCQLRTEEKLQEALRGIQVPTLLCGGIEDRMIPADLMFRTAKCMPNCKLIMYSKWSHAGPSSDYIEEVTAEYLHFLNCVEENEGRVYAKVIED